METSFNSFSRIRRDVKGSTVSNGIYTQTFHRGEERGEERTFSENSNTDYLLSTFIAQEWPIGIMYPDFGGRAQRFDATINGEQISTAISTLCTYMRDLQEYDYRRATLVAFLGVLCDTWNDGYDLSIQMDGD
jgi:hypothetical protein